MALTLFKGDRVIWRDGVMVAVRRCVVTAHGQYTVERAHRPDHERAAILAALNSTHWNRTEAAKQLGKSRVWLWQKMSHYGIGEPG